MEKTSPSELMKLDPEVRQRVILTEAAMSVDADRISGRGERIYEPVDRPQEYGVSMNVTDEEWGMLLNLVEDRIKHHTRYIERAQNHPSETVRSDTTIERHGEMIAKWGTIQGKMAENVW